MDIDCVMERKNERRQLMCVHFYPLFLLILLFYGFFATGLISMVSVCISMVSGIAALFSFECRRWLKPILNKFNHNLISIFAFVTGMASLIFIWKDGSWAKRNDPGNLRYMSAWCVGIITVLTCIGALKSLWFQFVGSYRIVTCKSDYDDDGDADAVDVSSQKEKV